MLPTTSGSSETHISWVILVGPYAYKLKKPVNFGFLDFTTLEHRRADCEAEVALNRRLCPDLYLGVVDVVQRDGRYRIGAPGEPFEPAVWMRRLPDSGLLPAVLARGTADERLMRWLAMRAVCDAGSYADCGRATPDGGPRP